MDVAKETNLSKEEVLWMFVELGAMMMVFSQEEMSVTVIIRKTAKSSKELKNWEIIAKATYGLFIDGGKFIESQKQ